MSKQVTIGRTVLYRLTEKDAEAVNRRRTSEGTAPGQWHWPEMV